MNTQKQSTPTTAPIVNLSQKKTLLALDDAPPVYSMLHDTLKRPILRVGTIVEAVAELVHSPEKYSGVLIEPYSERRDKIGALQLLMGTIRAGTRLPRLPVYIFTTHPEELVVQDFKLQKGKHYDVYLDKPSQEALNFLLNAP
jgi:hypothetical protein